GKKVLDHSMKIHFNVKGFVEYADSLWRKPFQLSDSPDTKKKMESVTDDLKAAHFAKFRAPFHGALRLDPVIFVDGHGVASHAFDVKIRSGHPHSVTRDLILDEQNGQVLEERRAVRHIPVATKAWPVSPFNT